MIDLSKYRKIHCIGVGGIGLSAIAQIFSSKGYIVSGSDVRESVVTDRLLSLGIKVFLEHDSKNVKDIDLVIYSQAVSEDNPELVEARKQKLPILTRAEALGYLMSQYDNSIAISGTHGKTTTTSMVSLITKKACLSPTLLVGGNLKEIDGNVEIGNGDCFVTEACEYMDSFLNLSPKIEIILNIDSDHLDYFKDIHHIVDSFSKFANLVPKEGLVIAYDANPFVRTAIKGLENVITFGFNSTSDYFVQDISFNDLGMPEFNIYYKDNILSKLSLKIPGEHNVLNALASFACCHQLGVDSDIISDVLNNFNGIDRRFDIIGSISDSRQLVDDYAHHPTEIKATLSASKQVAKGDIWCIFQPHTYTRTRALFHEFAESFKFADKIVLAEIYAAREKNIDKISSEQLVQEIKRIYPSKDVFYFDSFKKIAKFVYENSKNGDFLLTMGAGDIYMVSDMLLELDGSK